jgi:uncharacterized protein with GYD domain
MRGYVLMRVRTGEIGEALRQARSIRGVTQADMTFGPYDLVAQVEAPNLDALGTTVAWEIQSIPGVVETVTCLAVEPGAR